MNHTSRCIHYISTTLYINIYVLRTKDRSLLLGKQISKWDVVFHENISIYNMCIQSQINSMFRMGIWNSVKSWNNITDIILPHLTKFYQRLICHNASRSHQTQLQVSGCKCKASTKFQSFKVFLFTLWPWHSPSKMVPLFVLYHV